MPHLQDQSQRDFSSAEFGFNLDVLFRADSDLCAVPGVGVGHVESFAEQFVRIPLERFSGQFSKHLHLYCRLFVIQVSLTTKRKHQ